MHFTSLGKLSKLNKPICFSAQLDFGLDIWTKEFKIKIIPLRTVLNINFNINFPYCDIFSPQTYKIYFHLQNVPNHVQFSSFSKCSQSRTLYLKNDGKKLSFSTQGVPPFPSNNNSMNEREVLNIDKSKFSVFKTCFTERLAN